MSLEIALNKIKSRLKQYMLHVVFILSLNYAIYMAILFSDRETERYWKKKTKQFV